MKPAPTGGLFHPPATAQGERSGAASPWTPTGLLASLALRSLPTAWGYTRSPYGRRKRAQRSLVRRGTDAARPPATPSAAGCAGADPAGQRPPAAAFARAKATRGGVVRGTRKGRCRRRAVRRSDHGRNGYQHPGSTGRPLRPSL